MPSANVAATSFDLKMEVDFTGQAADITTIDFQLMERVGAGDHEAFRELVERHQGAVVGTVAKMLGNSSEAEDIAQQVEAIVWAQAGKKGGEGRGHGRTVTAQMQVGGEQMAHAR
jgi:hypothetical protein